MPQVDLPDDLFKRLEKHAKGFTTPAAVISMAVDALEAQANGAATPAAAPILDGRGNPLASFEALHPPSLTFTKVVSASFGGKPIKPANWNRLLQTALIEAHKKMGDFDKVRKVAAVNMVNGVKDNEGYQHIPEVGFSVQGTDANTAWRGVTFIAQNLKCDVEVSFLWRNKQGAEHPGRPGTMRLFGK